MTQNLTPVATAVATLFRGLLHASPDVLAALTVMRTSWPVYNGAGGRNTHMFPKRKRRS